VLEILDSVFEIVLEVVVEVVLHDGGYKQESAMKDHLKNCIADLEYAKIRLSKGYHGPGFTVTVPASRLYDS
jgi:hypothetical protein